MTSLGLIDGRSDGNFMGCFGSILARSWYMSDDPPSHSDLGAQLEWLSLLFSDQNRVRAAGLHAAYSQYRSQITNDEFARETLDQQHCNLQYRVTPIYRLPAEIMMEIFNITLDVGHLRRGLMHVCRHWYKIIAGMASVWASLDLGARTTPESVHHLWSRAGTHPLAVKIDVDKARSIAGRLQQSLAMAANKASQWQTLTITALPQEEPGARSNHTLLSIQLQPMQQLKHLKITEPLLSPLLRFLLQNIATTAIGKLTSMEIHSFPAVQYLLQPAHSSVFCSLTTFRAKLPKMNQPVDLLPHFMQLEVLELTNLLLPSLDNDSLLPLAPTLRHLYLKSVSIQWMGGRVFSQLENCTIIAPLADLPPHHDVQLPVCTKLHVENWNISPAGQFFAPTLDQLRVKSNAWSPYKGNEQVLEFVRAGFGVGLQPKSLSLSVTCTEQVLLSVLRLLPELVELKLDLPRPSALGKHFFTRLLARPGNQLVNESRFDWRELFRENGTEWRCTVCPSLRDLELTYHKWLRPGYNDDFIPPLLALSWSREKTETPLQSHVHYKTPLHSWESFNPTHPQVMRALSCLTIPRDGQVTQISLKTETWENAVFEIALVISFYYHLRGLAITSSSLTERHVLNVLPSFHKLRDLELSGVHVPPLDVDLPLVHTLRKLSLRNSTLAWMDGLVFTQLQRFSVDENGWPEIFKQKAKLPVCTHIAFVHDGLKTLPILCSHFHFPLLSTFEMSSVWGHSAHYASGIIALQRIQAKVFRLWVPFKRYPFLEFLNYEGEVEQLDLVFPAVVSATESVLPTTWFEVLSMLSETNPFAKMSGFPNMKVLRLQFVELTDPKGQQQVIRLCKQIMSNRRLDGYSMQKCYLWWLQDSWEKAAPFVVVTG